MKDESEEQHQVRLEDLCERDHERRQNESDERRERHLQNMREYNHVKLNLLLLQFLRNNES